MGGFFNWPRFWKKKSYLLVLSELKLALDQEVIQNLLSVSNQIFFIFLIYFLQLQQQKSKKLEESMRKLDEEMKRTDDLLYQVGIILILDWSWSRFKAVNFTTTTFPIDDPKTSRRSIEKRRKSHRHVWNVWLCINLILRCCHIYWDLQSNKSNAGRFYVECNVLVIRQFNRK